MKRLLLLSLLILTFSCKDKEVHSKSLRLSPVENIQMLFERHAELYKEEAGNWKRHFLDIKGNVLVLKKLKSAINFVEVHQSEILLEQNLHFVYDTASGNNKLYVIDDKKAFYLFPSKTIKQELEDGLVLTVVLPDEIKLQLPGFFAHNLEREIIAVDRNGFVAGASELSRTENGDLLIRK